MHAKIPWPCLCNNRAGLIPKHCLHYPLGRAVTRRDDGGGGGLNIPIIMFWHTVKTIVFKRNPSGRTQEYEYSPPPPPIIASSYGPGKQETFKNGVSSKDFG